MDDINFNKADQLTRRQLKLATKILQETLGADHRVNDPGLLGAVLVALATNMSHFELTQESRNSR